MKVGRPKGWEEEVVEPLRIEFEELRRDFRQALAEYDGREERDFGQSKQRFPDRCPCFSMGPTYPQGGKVSMCFTCLSVPTTDGAPGAHKVEHIEVSRTVRRTYKT